MDRRGYAVASDVPLRVGLGNIEDKPVKRDGSEAYSAWAPDPVTGYYRPINHTLEIDPVDLRNMLLNHKLRLTH
uniref:Late embryogenesis abundant protein Lea5 n=1 Tax=Cajanus cajan TaxID=3821 RepID=A0A151STM0_CAJCA|nr:hypothetical protein KK1_004399 [Cajanus cajan]